MSRGQIGFLEDNRPPKGAWAPGGYYSTCRTCEGKFIGDKRATSCAPCAYAEQPKKQDPVMSDIQQHLKQYREAEQALCDYIDATMPYGTLVRVDFRGRVLHGTSLGSNQGRPDNILVQLERNAIAYAIECVRPITDDERNNLPEWLR